MFFFFEKSIPFPTSSHRRGRSRGGYPQGGGRVFAGPKGEKQRRRGVGGLMRGMKMPRATYLFFVELSLEFFFVHKKFVAAEWLEIDRWDEME